MHQHNFGGRIDLRQRVGHGLLARIAAVHHAGGTADGGFGDDFLQRDDIVGAGGEEKIGDRGAGGQTAQGENHQRHAVEFEKLFRQYRRPCGCRDRRRE